MNVEIQKELGLYTTAEIFGRDMESLDLADRSIMESGDWSEKRLHSALDRARCLDMDSWFSFLLDPTSYYGVHYTDGMMMSPASRDRSYL